LRGLMSWRASGLQIPQEVLDFTDQYRTESDLLGRFMSDCVVIDEVEVLLLICVEAGTYVYVHLELPFVSGIVTAKRGRGEFTILQLRDGHRF